MTDNRMPGHHPGSLHIPDPRDATGTPLDSPLSGLPPARFADGEVVTFQYATEPAAIRALLPAPLEPVNDTVQVARWGDVPGMGRDVHECNVMVAARYRGGHGTVLGAYNHIDGRPAIRQLTARDLTDLAVRECYEGPCTAEIRPSATAPLYRLPARTFLEGFYWRCDFTLVGGTILHDYLDGQQQ
jgi:acetoacetate decarboxylase